MIFPSHGNLLLLEVIIILLGLKQQFTGWSAKPVSFGNLRTGLWMKDGEGERAGPQLGLPLGRVTMFQSLFVLVRLNQGLQVLHICINFSIRNATISTFLHII